MKNENKSNQEFGGLSRKQLAALYTSATVSNLINEFLTAKFGAEYVKFMEETAKKWIEASKKASEPIDGDAIIANATQGARPQSANTKNADKATENSRLENHQDKNNS